MIRLATENGNPVSEKYEDMPDHALVTVSLLKRDLNSCYHGLWNVISACGRLAQAVHLAQEGQHEEAEKRVDGALHDLAISCAHAKAVYERVRAKAVRTNRRKS